jgi:imidazole glycerol-phosphate synthase subunit HisH
MIGILSVGAGNIGSLQNAIFNLGFDTRLVSNVDDFALISHLVLPGVGSYSTAMSDLRSRNLDSQILDYALSGKPLLGICLGMQLLSTSGEEGSLCQGLGLIPGRVVKIPNSDNLRVPHMGWNDIHVKRHHPIFDGVRPGVDFYFVHSYHFIADTDDSIISSVDYGLQITAAIGFNNVVGTQFHPEKSQKNGIRILENFCLWDGKC